jgi:hypothetical protein
LKLPHPQFGAANGAELRYAIADGYTSLVDLNIAQRRIFWV